MPSVVVRPRPTGLFLMLCLSFMSGLRDQKKPNQKQNNFNLHISLHSFLPTYMGLVQKIWFMMICPSAPISSSSFIRLIVFMTQFTDCCPVWKRGSSSRPGTTALYYICVFIEFSGWLNCWMQWWHCSRWSTQAKAKNVCRENILIFQGIPSCLKHKGNPSYFQEIKISSHK